MPATAASAAPITKVIEMVRSTSTLAVEPEANLKSAGGAVSFGGYRLVRGRHHRHLPLKRRTNERKCVLAWRVVRILVSPLVFMSRKARQHGALLVASDRRSIGSRLVVFGGVGGCVGRRLRSVPRTIGFRTRPRRTGASARLRDTKWAMSGTAAIGDVSIVQLRIG